MADGRKAPSPEELLAAWQRDQEEERLENVLAPFLEKRQCEQWGVLYDEKDGTHRARLAAIFTGLREMLTTHGRTKGLLGVAGRAVGAGSQSMGKKAWDALMGALVLIGLGWLATKLGFKLPGVP